MGEPKIIFREATRLFGKNKILDLAAYNVEDLWKSFMPLKHKIQTIESDFLYSVSEYPKHYFENFSPHAKFAKWAAVSVDFNQEIPDQFEELILPASWYAVFHFNGDQTPQEFFSYIYGVWLISSGFELNDCPHFELLPSNYNKLSSKNEEDIFVPILRKNTSISF